MEASSSTAQQPKRHGKGPAALPPNQASSSTSVATPDSPALERERLLAKAKQKNVEYGSGGVALRKAVADEQQHVREVEGKDSTTLIVAFMTMILVGTGNRVFMKLQTYPMYNYPFFLSMLTVFVYIPACFVYIIPMMLFGTAITPQQRAIPKHKFMVMGLLDSVAGIMGVFAVNYIANAAVIVLLQQAAIPISMAISKMFLKARYSKSQYFGATVVVAGIIFTLIPTFLGAGPAHGGPGASSLSPTTQVIWSVVQVLSCIPMCLSSVYKEQALGEEDIDVIYLNGWVAIYQFLANILLAVPSAMAMGLPIRDLPVNIADGWRCFTGVNSHTATMAAMSNPGFDSMADLSATSRSAAMVVDHCELAPLFVSLYLCFNIAYNVVLIVILKHGSANVLWLASTIMVPIGNVAFSLKFVPGHQDLRPTDMGGLAFILLGLVIYRFSAPLVALIKKRQRKATAEEEEAGRKVRLVERGVTKQSAAYVGLNQAEFLEPMISTRVWKAQRARLSRSPEQIRGSFLLRLGIPPSPHVSLRSSTPTAGGSGGSGGGGVGGGGRRPAWAVGGGAGARPSPLGWRGADPGHRPSPVLSAVPRRGYARASNGKVVPVTSPAAAGGPPGAAAAAAAESAEAGTAGLLQQREEGSANPSLGENVRQTRNWSDSSGVRPGTSPHGLHEV